MQYKPWRTLLFAASPFLVSGLLLPLLPIPAGIATATASAGELQSIANGLCDKIPRPQKERVLFRYQRFMRFRVDSRPFLTSTREALFCKQQQGEKTCQRKLRSLTSDNMHSRKAE